MPDVRPVFRDPQLEQQFQEQGFVKVPFLDPEAVAALTSAYHETLAMRQGPVQPEEEKHASTQKITYDFTFIDRNSAYKQQVLSIIYDAFRTPTDQLLDRYRPIIGNFIHKAPSDGEVPLHQNWAFVDEHRATSVSIWCPLVDSDARNGTLEVVPGSHKRFGEVRGPMIRWELETIGQTIIQEHMEPQTVRAGEAIILDDSLVHYSAPNRGGQFRLAIQLILIPEELPSIHYHMDPAADPHRVEVLEVDQEFYMTFNPWKKPAANTPRVRSFTYQPFSLDAEAFRKRLRQPRFDAPRPPAWQRLLGQLFGS
ncbi:MAG: phytanoyl-CoA dioxygenase family protein [Bacteroidota bacterium]